jgi:uncharacterized protein (TIGR00369 family)
MFPEPPPGFQLYPQHGGFAQSFGPIYLHAEGGRLGFRVTQGHLNVAGVCHGGALASFADLQMIAIRTALGPVVKHRPTVNLSVDYVAPAPLGAWVEAAVTLVKATRSMVFTHALITADGAVVAQSRAIYHTPRA